MAKQILLDHWQQTGWRLVQVANIMGTMSLGSLVTIPHTSFMDLATASMTAFFCMSCMEWDMRSSRWMLVRLRSAKRAVSCHLQSLTASLETSSLEQEVE